MISSNNFRAVTTQQHVHHAHGARANQSKGDMVKFVRELKADDAKRADDLCKRLNEMHDANGSGLFHCGVDEECTSGTLVGFRPSGGSPVIIQVHDKTKLGQGAFGSVYESNQLLQKAPGGWGVPEGDQYQRVMKIQKPSGDASSETAFAFQQSGSLGAGIIGGYQYLDQLRIPGKCLQKFFEDEKWSLKNRFECAVAMVECARLYWLGQKAHPDLKPHNMMFDPVKKEVSFIDNANVTDLENPRYNKTEGPRGTPIFIAPEQYRNCKVSDKTMVYSIGITLLNLFSNKPAEYAVAQSMVTRCDPGAQRGCYTKLDPGKLLPEFRKSHEKFVEQLQATLIEMVSDNEWVRPDLDTCVTRFISFESGYKFIDQHEVSEKNGIDAMGYAEYNKMVAYIKAMEEGQRIDADKRAEQRAEALAKEKIIIKGQQETDRMRKRTIKAESNIKQMTDQFRELEGTVEVEREQNRLREERARAREQNKKTEYESKLAAKDEAVVAIKKKLEAEKALNAERLQELSNTRSEEIQAPLDGLKKLASNQGLVDKATFGKQLPGVLGIRESNAVKIKYLEDLATFIFCNSPGDGGVNPYTHQSSFRPLSFHRRQQDFTATQRAHLDAVTLEAKTLAEKMLHDEKSKQEACRFLQESFVAWVQTTDVLSKENGWAERLLASTPKISNYQFTPEQRSELSNSALCAEFKDGRDGNPGKSKQLTELMTSLEAMSEMDAARSFLTMLQGDEPVIKLDALEHEFLSILTSSCAYTRGEQCSVASAVESLWTGIVGETYIREDIDSPSATKIRHIAFLRQCYDLVLESLMGRELTSREVEVLSKSRLVKFSPAQYQHELQSFQNELMYKVTTLLESKQNVETYKNYLRQKYTAKFDEVY